MQTEESVELGCARWQIFESASSHFTSTSVNWDGVMEKKSNSFSLCHIIARHISLWSSLFFEINVSFWRLYSACKWPDSSTFRLTELPSFGANHYTQCNFHPHSRFYWMSWHHSTFCQFCWISQFQVKQCKAIPSVTCALCSTFSNTENIFHSLWA